MKKILGITLALCMLFAVAACDNGTHDSSDPTPTPAPTDPTPAPAPDNPNTSEEVVLQPFDLGGRNKLVLVADQTAGMAENGRAVVRGSQLAVKEINEQYGTDFVLEVFDDRLDATEAVNIAARVLADPSVFVVMPAFSGPTLATGPIYNEAGLLCVAPSASNQDVPHLGEYVFATTVSQKFEGAVFAEALAAYKGGTGRLAVLHEATDQALQAAGLFRDTWVGLGGEDIYFDSYIPGTTSDFSPMLTAIKALEPDFLYVYGTYADTANAFFQARNLDMDDVQLLGGGITTNNEYLELVGSRINGAITMTTIPSFHEVTLNSSPSVPDRYFRFAEDFQKEFNMAPCGFTAHGYDTTKLLMELVLEHQSTDTPVLANALASIRDWEAMAGYNMRFNEDGELNKSAFIYEVRDGHFIHLFPFEF